MRLSFLGDISLNNEYVNLYHNGVNPFEKVEASLQNTEHVIGNLECMAAGEEGENLLKKPRLTTTVETLNYLSHIRLSIAALANNHVFDCLWSGFEKTINHLTQKQINYFGASNDQKQASKPLEIHNQDFSIALFNYVTADTNPSLPEDCPLKLNFFEIEKAIADIRGCSASFKVLILHWGGKFENSLFPGKDQVKTARQLIDNGADMIIGHHPHTFQPYEKYKGKYIFYSIGNFCFSDVHSSGITKIILNKKRFTESAVIHVDFTKHGYEVQLDPIKNKNHYLEVDWNLLTKYQRRNKLFRLFQSFPIFWDIYHFYFRRIEPLVRIVYKRNDGQSFMYALRKFRWKKLKNLYR